jgi:hypothetical protein
VVTAPKVVEDAREAAGREVHRPPWGWLAAGLLVGAGLTVLFLRVEAGAPPTATTVAGSPSGASSLGGIADEVDRFPDGLVAATRSDGQSLELLIWPPTSELYERAIPVGASSPPDPVAFDTSGRRMATLLPVPGMPFGVLYAGVPENAAIIDLDVTGYAWHDSAPAALAYTTFADDELSLWVTRGNLAESELVAEPLGIEGRVAAWGDWGFAIEDDVRDSIVLITDHGEIKGFHTGRVLDSEAGGWIAIDDAGLGLLSAGGGVRGVESHGIEGNLLSAGFSPDGRLLAVLTTEVLSVLSLDADLGLIDSIGRPGVPQVVWSSDSRFVLYPGSRGLIVVDTHNGDVHELLSNRTFTGLGILPLTES